MTRKVNLSKADVRCILVSLAAGLVTFLGVSGNLFPSQNENEIVFSLLVAVAVWIFLEIVVAIRNKMKEKRAERVASLGGNEQATIFRAWLLVAASAMLFAIEVIHGIEVVKSPLLNFPFPAFDFLLLIVCPFTSALGLFVSKYVNRADNSFSDENVNTGKNKKVDKNIGIVPGLALGLVIALYFAGSVDTIGEFYRIIALSILLGYQAPCLLTKQ